MICQDITQRDLHICKELWFLRFARKKSIQYGYLVRGFKCYVPSVAMQRLLKGRAT